MTRLPPAAMALALALILLAPLLLAGCASHHARRSGNPVLPGWYADPDSAALAGQWWIYPPIPQPYDDQTHFDAFSSEDLVTWTRHENILTAADVSWARRAMWAPCIAHKDGRYYLFFGANDIQSDDELGGIGVAVGDSPAGPFRDHLGRPLVDAFHNGAQPIDQAVFQDPADGRWYLYYGGWGHCNVAQLNDDFTGFVPFDDADTFREITPDGYVEGPTMLARDGRYYFMWSEGGWTGPDYRVAYAVADSPLGPFERAGVILAQDPAVATGAGHHSALRVADDEWVIVYHRRPLAETDRNHRVVCLDRLTFADDGLINPVRIGFEGVPASHAPDRAR
ncbi:MAG: glycoside hydrolase family 43 protein [Phycisphaerales bacterium]